jgi:hypothetical protein
MCTFHQRILNLYSHLFGPFLQLLILLKTFVNMDPNVLGNESALDIDLIRDNATQATFNLSFPAAGSKDVKSAELPFNDLLEQIQ